MRAIQVRADKRDPVEGGPGKIGPGKIGAGHVAVIRSFCQRLPDFVDVEPRQEAEAQLARLGGEHRPDELSKLADKLSDCLNPDGTFTDEDRARRRGITIGKQGFDGMSPITGYLTPETRASIDAVFAKLAAPGMCNPEDDTPCVEGSPSETSLGNDTRSSVQRTTTRSTPPRAPCWRPVIWGSTTAYRHPSSSPPPCANWRQGRVRGSPEAARYYLWAT